GSMLLWPAFAACPTRAAPPVVAVGCGAQASGIVRALTPLGTAAVTGEDILPEVSLEPLLHISARTVAERKRVLRVRHDQGLVARRIHRGAPGLQLTAEDAADR